MGTGVLALTALAIAAAAKPDKGGKRTRLISQRNGSLALQNLIGRSARGTPSQKTRSPCECVQAGIDIATHRSCLQCCTFCRSGREQKLHQCSGSKWLAAPIHNVLATDGIQLRRSAYEDVQPAKQMWRNDIRVLLEIIQPSFLWSSCALPAWCD